MKKPSGSAAAKQASSAKPGFQPSAVAQFTAIEISSGRIGRMRKLFMAGDRTDGFMNYITGGDAMAVPPKASRPKLRARIQRPGLGGQHLQLPARNNGDGIGPHHRRQSRTGIPAKR